MNSSSQNNQVVVAPSHDDDSEPIQSIGEEIANGVTHLIGLGLSIAGLSIILVAAARRGTAWHVTGGAIFGSTMILLYLSSTIYHFVHFKLERTKRFFRFMDHASIYLLIAGSYTAITLTFLRRPLGWTLFGLEWGIAVVGILFKAIGGHRANTLSTIGYVVMGWLVVIAAYPIITEFSSGGLFWLVAGGMTYTLGVPFYFLDEKVKYFHAIWHLFVMGGSLCHFFMVWLYLIPAA